MRPNGKKLISAIGLMVTLSIFIGCGSGSDLLDEEETRYNAVALPFDGTQDSTNEIDVPPLITDCDGNGTADDPEEGLFPFDIQVIIDSDVDSGADFRVESYDVTLRPNHGAYTEFGSPDVIVSLDASQIPALTGTAINPLSYSISSPVIKPGIQTTLDLLIWSQGDKSVYVQIVDDMPIMDETITVGAFTIYEWETADFVYDVQVVLHCRTLENDTFTITTPWTPVHFANFNRCS